MPKRASISKYTAWEGCGSSTAEEAFKQTHAEQKGVKDTSGN